MKVGYLFPYSFMVTWLGLLFLYEVFTSVGLALNICCSLWYGGWTEGEFWTASTLNERRHFHVHLTWAGDLGKTQSGQNTTFHFLSWVKQRKTRTLHRHCATGLRWRGRFLWVCVDPGITPAKMNPVSEWPCWKSSCVFIAPQTHKQCPNVKDHKGPVGFLQFMFLSCWQMITANLEWGGSLWCHDHHSTSTFSTSTGESLLSWQSYWHIALLLLHQSITLQSTQWVYSSK